jgi:hypothetical protein
MLCSSMPPQVLLVYEGLIAGSNVASERPGMLLHVGANDNALAMPISSWCGATYLRWCGNSNVS